MKAIKIINTEMEKALKQLFNPYKQFKKEIKLSSGKINLIQFPTQESGSVVLSNEVLKAIENIDVAIPTFILGTNFTSESFEIMDNRKIRYFCTRANYLWTDERYREIAGKVK